MGAEWLMLSYNLPTRPSRYRVQLWRDLRKLGAVNVQQSVWILPGTQHNDQELVQLAKWIETNGGSALLFRTVFVLSEHEERVFSLLKQDGARCCD